MAGGKWLLALLPAAVACAPAAAPLNRSEHVVVRLDVPWPAGIGRASPAAARAVRSAAAGDGRPPTFVEVTLARDEWKRLEEAAGGSVRLLADDATAFYARRAAAWPALLSGALRHNASSRRLSALPGARPSVDVISPALHSRGGSRRLGTGSMGGFWTLDEAYEEMESLRQRHPTRLSAPIRVGTSRQGRPLQAWCLTEGLVGCKPAGETAVGGGPTSWLSLRFSGGGAGEGKGVEADVRPARPAVLYTALVHAREPQTLMCLLRFVEETLSQADSSPGSDAHRLIRSRRVILLPVANPDGYSWNEQTSPRGGGMRRKNGLRTCTSTGSSTNDGVDLNRNFGHKWGYDLVGSSTEGCSEEFRGSAAFSEPETQAIRFLVRSFRPVATLHWHGWGEDVAFPFSYDWRAKLSVSQLSLYQEYAAEMTARNGYASGRAWEVVGYTTNGEADDWGWGDEGVFSFTLEVGNSRDGFWPKPERIRPIADQNVWPATYLLAAAGPMMQVDGVRMDDVDASGSSGNLNLTLQNNGLAGYLSPHLVCVRSLSSHLALGLSPSWHPRGASPACVALAPLGARQAAALPPLPASWSKATGFLEVEMTISVEPAGGGQVEPPAVFRVRVDSDDETLRTCDDLCHCVSADSSSFTISSACRAKLRPGSSCRVPLRAAAGTSFAGGILDEFYSYTATGYTRGGLCRVGALHRDTLLAVYAACGRTGAQEPLGFSNSETHTAQTEFPCQAGTTYHIFWNAEYLPGRHGFTIDERCGSAAPAGCERALPAAGGGGRMATGRELGHSGRNTGKMTMRRANARRG